MAKDELTPTPTAIISISLRLREVSMLSELVSGHVDTFYDRPMRYTAADAALFQRWVELRDSLRFEIRKVTRK